MKYRDEVQKIHDANSEFYHEVAEMLRVVQEAHEDEVPQEEYVAMAELWHGMQQVEEGCRKYLEALEDY